ncbi:hypothetical protein D3C72_1529620 [compost metagenome]
MYWNGLGRILTRYGRWSWLREDLLGRRLSNGRITKNFMYSTNDILNTDLRFYKIAICAELFAT